MSKLYASVGSAWSADCARMAIDGLFSQPTFGGIWLIRMEEETVGYLVLTVCYSLEFHGRYGLIDELYMEEKWRSRGIGAQALRFADDQCRLWGLKEIRLEVARTNLRDLAMYERNGFVMNNVHLMSREING